MIRSAPLLLVVDDDPAIRRALGAELAAAGFAVAEAADGEAGLERFRELEPDVVLTDLAMPRRDGIALIGAIRKASATPLVVLSVRGEEDDKIRALDAGADDYVTKPFSMREVLARVRAQLRRTRGAAPAVRRFPGLELDLERRRVTVDGREIRLTPTELAILDLLTAEAGKPVSIAKIVARVWKGAPATSSDTVRVHVGSLRRKLEPDPGNPRYLATEPWIGYRFLAEAED